MPPLKSISVTPIKRGGSRKQPSPSIDVETLDPDAAALPARAQQRRLSTQPIHRYRVGDRLKMTGGGYSISRVASTCKVIMLLPWEGRGALLYRVRGETESFERVVAEADLSRS